MKLPSGMLLLCLALAVSSRAEEVMPVKTEAAAVKRELVWPEIKDPQALIEFAKAEIKRVGEGGKKWGWPITVKSEFAYLRPGDCYVQPEYLVIELDTHPATGQALLILPNSSSLNEQTKNALTRIEETIVPEIKRVLGRMDVFSNYSRSVYDAYAQAIVRFQKFQNLENSKNTWPIPVELSLPDYPIDMARHGVHGEANVEFSVTELGSISALKVKATHQELEFSVRKAAQLWRFEPGVDLKSRLPAETRMSLTVLFRTERE